SYQGTSGGENTFFLRLTSAGNIDFAVYDTDKVAYPFHTTTAPLAGDMVPGKTLGIRVGVDLDNLRISRMVSRDAGRTWENVGTGGSPIASSSPLVTKGVNVAGRG